MRDYLAAITGDWGSLLRALLGLEPEGDRLLSRPVQVDAIGWLALRGVPGRWGRSDTAH